MVRERFKEGVFDLFDLDGTVRPPPLKGESPIAPPRELGTIFRGLRKSGRQLGAASGVSMEGARTVERQMRFRFDLVAVSYTCRVAFRGGRTPSELFLAPREEHAAFRFGACPELNRVADHFRAQVDDRTACFTMFLTPDSPEFYEAGRMVDAIIKPHGKMLKALKNPDGGITVLPASGGKHLIVEYLIGDGNNIGVAAGDTGSDAPLIRAAKFPIVTRTDEHTPVKAELAAIVRERGVGFIAERPHAWGLLDGLLAARDQGFLTF